MKSFVLWISSFCLLLAATPVQAGIIGTVVDYDGNVISQHGPQGRDVAVCAEAEDLGAPTCTTATGSCLDAVPIGTCVRAGFLYRLTMCSDPGSNPHEGHPHNWAALDPLPPTLGLRTPFGTSTAYVGGDIGVTPSPPFHNGLHFGPLTGPFCDSFTVNASDTCPTIPEVHGVCDADFLVFFRTLDVHPNDPLPHIDTGSVPDGRVGLFYSIAINASGGIENFIFSITNGALPLGLGISAGGSITGIPQEFGTFNFTVQALEDPTDPIWINPGPCSNAPPCTPLSDAVGYSLTIADATTTSSSSSTSSSTTTTTTTTSTTSTTTITLPCRCGQPVTTGPKPMTTDSLYILKAAVGSKPCRLCTCDVDSSCKINTTDALKSLQNAVGKDVPIHCDCDD